jgi:hypothetical protein
LDWVKDDVNQKGETIRFAMVAARTHGVVELDEWNGSLTETRESLRRRKGRGNRPPPDDEDLFGG